MIVPTELKGRRVGVVGLGRSGWAAAESLRAAGATPVLWDDSPAKRAEAEVRGYAVGDLATDDLSGMPLIVWSPGVPHNLPRPHPAALNARSRGVPVVCDIDLLGRSDREARFVGITGTNGKSTTTALTGHILKRAGYRATLGGNLGTPVMSLEPMGRLGIHVLELSSYQTELTSSIAFEAAAQINLTPDHLDRHGDMAGYAAAKRRIFEAQRPGQAAVIGVDDDWGRRLVDDLRASGGQRVIPISVEREAPGGVFVRGREMVDDIDGRNAPVADFARFPRLLGSHNRQNICVAFALARALKVETDAILGAIGDFPGLEHRQRVVATILGVRFVNDSKATNADATAKALAVFKPIYWILGGRAKSNGLDGLEPLMSRVRRAFLIGEAEDRFAEWLDKAGVPYDRCGTLDIATAAAAEAAWTDAQRDAVVLLSPACASFDQFPDFEKRGEAFIRHVQDLRSGSAE